MPAFVRGIYPEMAKRSELSPVIGKTLSNEQRHARSPSAEELPTMNIFHPRVVTLVLELLTSNDGFLRRSPFIAAPAEKEGKIRRNGNDRRYGAARWSCARVST